MNKLVVLIILGVVIDMNGFDRLEDTKFICALEKDTFLDYFHYVLTNQEGPHLTRTYDSLYSKLNQKEIGNLPWYHLCYERSDSVSKTIGEERFRLIENMLYGDDHSIRARNVLSVHLGSRDSIKVEGFDHHIEYIDTIYKYFILNPDDDPDYSEKRFMNIPGIGEHHISKGFTNIVCHALPDSLGNRSSWPLVFEVYRVIQKTDIDLRNQFSKSYFGKWYQDLSDEEKLSVNLCFPFLVCFQFMPHPPPPPPPPKQDTLELYIKMQQEAELQRILKKNKYYP